MTDRELSHLRRVDLIELLIARTREVEQLRRELDECRQRLDSREILIDQAGSIAEAALQLNGLFEDAQQAAEQYLENIRTLSQRQEEVRAKTEEESRRSAERILSEARDRCRALEAETSEKCRRQVEAAKRESEAYWSRISGRIRAAKSEGEDGGPNTDGRD